MDKHTLTHAKNLKELADLGGVVKTSSWISGRGKYSACRAVPPYCARIERKAAGASAKSVQRYFAQHPHVQAVIAITDRRSANKLIQEKLG